MCVFVGVYLLEREREKDRVCVCERNSDVSKRLVVLDTVCWFGILVNCLEGIEPSAAR